MEQERDWYQILEITEKATELEIKAAYRRLVKKYHPDTHANDKSYTDKFNDISEAYKILENPKKRQEYDRRRKQNQEKSASTKNQQGEKQSESSPNFNFENINKNFEDFFGFNHKTKDITREDKVKSKKNPLDTTDMFEKFMGIKR
ncbi:DnaJ-like protein [Lachnotalea glycerini]|uniref:DnaJ-like protein n=1 Tax=Lachnotalea glycerini TaxID=1763509 RepID=A0A318EIQ5_9FIRM|nr:DnaJ domain-containing protein [Lachnotalea glycerini]PXV86916.1 DnaJ-like protein [Lachnotalea glycerini]